MKSIEKYFPDLTAHQYSQFEQLGHLYATWNAKINVISRKDIENIYIHHVLFSLSISRIISFALNTKIMDAGTGGGFPGIPLAILFPHVDFTLVDSVAKKIKVGAEVAKELELKNVHAVRERFEDLNGSWDFIIGRAVGPLPEFSKMVFPKISKEQKNDLPNGILYLKGGDFGEELKGLPHKYKIYEISSFFDDPFFQTKKIIHLYS